MYGSLAKKDSSCKAIGILPFFLFNVGLHLLSFSYFRLVAKCAIAPRKGKPHAFCQDLFAFRKKWQ